MSQFEELLKQRILILDGAMGTMIQRHKLEEVDYRGRQFRGWESDLKGLNDLLVLTQPKIIKDIHAAYLMAGADIIESNTFNATAHDLDSYGMGHLAYEINEKAAKLAREVADEFSSAEKPRFVAGVLGPTRKMSSLGTDAEDPAKRDITFDDLVGDYVEAAKGLINGGADLILIETIFDTLNA